MTYTSNIRAAIDGLHDTQAATGAALESATLASVTDPTASNGITLGSAIANAKRARDRIDAVLESLEAARASGLMAHAKTGEPSKVHRLPPRLIATGTPPLRDYPDQPA